MSTASPGIILVFLTMGVLSSGCHGELIGGAALTLENPASHDGPVERTAKDLGVDRSATEKTDLGDGIWRPKPGTTWQWQLRGKLDLSLAVQMFDIDLFSSSTKQIADLKASGRAVVCYFSAGTFDPSRPDAEAFTDEVIGNENDDWPEEHWLDIRTPSVKKLMSARLDLARSKGCDGVEPDNVDGFANDSGFDLSAADQLAYNIFLAREAHQRGLSIGLKNDLDQVPELVAHFDWALNEVCLSFGECQRLLPFIHAGKAVFHVEYEPAAKLEQVCRKTLPWGFDTLLKKLNLNAWVKACRH